MIGCLRDELGIPAGGWPEPFRTRALQGRTEPKPVTPLTPEDEAGLDGTSLQRREIRNRLLLPGPIKEFLAHRAKYGNTSLLSTNQFFHGLRYGEEHHVRLAPAWC